ncbi:hypothetical protein [Marinoscillum sp.]|uniref:hypothetical protein n=1 Tax=Marinoscillum sp. TaxID=2024838 RepID=UPI0033026020
MMEEFLRQGRQKYFLKLGKNRLSPVLEASTVLGLDYSQLVFNDSIGTLSPFFFCFPDKKAASLWMSITLLTNYFLDDYITSNNNVNIDLENGDLVDIYGSTLRFIRTDFQTGKLIFSTSDLPGGLKIPSTIKSIIKRTKNSRVNTHAHYKKAKRVLKENRNAISKVLEPDESVIINEQVLKSKVLLISGRGNGKSFRELLNTNEIEGEKLSKVFPENKNLLLKPDLEIYKNVSTSNYQNESRNFFKMFGKFIEQNEEPELIQDLKNLEKILKKDHTITSEFHYEFTTFCNELELDNYPKLKFVESKYPGFRELIPSNLKAVVVNDIQCVTEYKKTIDYFLEKKIPVIIVSDRKIQNTKEFGTYKYLFDSNPHFFRINWNKKKIESLKKCEASETEYLDKSLWEQCKRYCDQKIQIKIFDGTTIDENLSILQKKISDLDEFEILKKTFFKCLYPALYAIKNSSTINSSVESLIHEFKLYYDTVAPILDNDLRNTISLTIDSALEGSKNTKEIQLSVNSFSIVLSKEGDDSVFIPVDTNTNLLPSSTMERIEFTGFPYNEYSGQYLLNATFEHFIPDISILCWPNEARLTYGFLQRRLLAGYFQDKLPETNHFNKQDLIASIQDVEKEVDCSLIMEGDVKEGSIEQEEILQKTHSYKYSGYSRSSNNNSNSLVKCDIVNFVDNAFMFLPKGAKILSEKEIDNGKTKITNLFFSELAIGLRIFKFKKDRTAYREIAKKDNYINECFQKLELWKRAIEKMYESCSGDLEEVERVLKEVQNTSSIEGSNPSRSNIRRWLFDDEIIAPDTKNLELILTAINNSEIDHKLEELTDAYRAVLSFTIGLSSQIKKSIRNELNKKAVQDDSFLITIQETPVMVETKTISGLEKNEMLIEYSETRKILC